MKISKMEHMSDFVRSAEILMQGPKYLIYILNSGKN